MCYAHYLGRACIYGEERGRSRYQYVLRITWDAPVFTERKGKGKEIRGSRNQCHYLGRCIYGEESGSGEGVVTNALCALPGARLYLRRGVEREGNRDKGWS